MNSRAFVSDLPDLISPDSYKTDLHGRQIRLRIRLTDEGIEILGDAMRPDELEKLLECVSAAEIEQMLCG